MSESIGDLNMVLSMTDRISAPMKSAEGNVSSGSSAITSHLGSIVGAIGGLVVAKVGFDALKEGLRSCIDASNESALVMAQTEAAVKSTGGAAGYSSEEIAGMADELSKVAPIPHDTIQSAENMLLTFTNIGKDVFPQATKATLDMATALHLGPEQAALTLGKALNDPVQGVTALQRVGVKLTDQQKDQVKAMVAAGDTAGAQKLILAELTKETGGSAEAAGKTFPGQLEILHNSLSMVEEKIGNAVIPIFVKFASIAVPAVTLAIGVLSSVIARISTALTGPLTAAFNVVHGLILSIFETFSGTENVKGIDMIQDALDSVFGSQTALKITAILSLVSDKLAQAFTVARNAITTLGEALSGNWTDSSKIDGVSRVVGNIGLIIRNQVYPALLQIGAFMAGTLWPIFKQVLGFLIDHWNQFFTVIEPGLSIIIRLAAAIGQNGLAGGLAKLPSIIQTTIGSFTTIFGGLAKILLPSLEALAGQIKVWALQFGGQFVGWLAPQVGPILKVLGDLLLALGTWIVTIAAPAIGGQLLSWGTAFVDWVAPQIKPALDELGKLLSQLGTWIIGTALPAIGSALLQWGGAFIGWVAPQIPPLLLELAKLYIQLEAWLLTVALPDIVLKLVQWGTAFVSWVAPQIPPLLLELGKLLLSLGDWLLTTALPTVVANLAKLSAQFTAWVAPQIPPLLIELGKLLLSMSDWVINTAIPAIAIATGKLALAFLDWVATDVLPLIPPTLNKLTDAMGTWLTGTAIPWAGTELAKLGVAMVQAIWDGMKSMGDWFGKQVGGLISDAVPGPLKSAFKALPGFAGGVSGFGGGMAWVGEQGAEPVFMPKGSTVVSHRDAMSALSGGGGGNTPPTSVPIIIGGNQIDQLFVDWDRKRVTRTY